MAGMTLRSLHNSARNSQHHLPLLATSRCQDQAKKQEFGLPRMRRLPHYRETSTDR